MTQQQLNRCRAMRQSGFKLKEIARVVGVPYSEIHKQLTGPPKTAPVIAPARCVTVEDHGKKLLAKKPAWFKGSDWAWRELVEANFGKVGT